MSIRLSVYPSVWCIHLTRVKISEKHKIKRERCFRHVQLLQSHQSIEVKNPKVTVTSTRNVETGTVCAMTLE